MHMHLPYISEGAHLVIAAAQTYGGSVRRHRSQLVWSEVFPGSSNPHVRYWENKYGHFIFYGSMSSYVQECDESPGQTDIPGISAHNAVPHSCTKKS